MYWRLKTICSCLRSHSLISIYLSASSLIPHVWFGSYLHNTHMAGLQLLDRQIYDTRNNNNNNIKNVNYCSKFSLQVTESRKTRPPLPICIWEPMAKARGIQKSSPSTAACAQTTRKLLAMGNGRPDFVVDVMIPSTVIDRYIHLFTP
jgi:hypothetical protein